MARIRSIHPKILESEDVAVWSPWGQLAWVKIWLVMDDKGRVKDNPQFLASTLFPLNDDQGETEMRGYIDEWIRSGVVCRYESDGKSYLHAVKWDEFQKPKYPTPSKLPECALHESSPSPGGALGKGSPTRGEEEERRGVEKEEERRAAGAASLPIDQSLSSQKPRCPRHQGQASVPPCSACARLADRWKAERSAIQPIWSMPS